MVLLLALACGGPTVPSAWNDPKPTQLERYEVALAVTPDPPPLGELFSVDATVRFLDGQPLEDGTVKLDARMPQHGHGMQTDPVADPGVCDANGKCKHPGGHYHVDGFKFHMAGDWTITVDVNGPEGPDSTSFVYGMAG
jgi:hypothetical protein